MRFSKPAWVTHQDSVDQKRVPLYSCHVHPDGSRLATGGLDAKVRIWSTLPVLRPDMEHLPKLLCTLTMHTGPVLVVRWNYSGRWLASGSDDAIVMIWDMDPNGGGSVWGSEEANVEGWKPLKRLPGHESDVTDLAWSPKDRYLASVGLDSKVIIWCGRSLEALRKLDQHHGFVKGVCWDPVGEFLATQSDDKSVKVWRTNDWGLEATITKPFEDSPGSTFFRRLSWSPDGAHITASNAMNNNGYIFIAAVITRSDWKSDISLVGHENTVEVACYNPHIFLRDPGGELTSSNICSVVALGADDLSVSIWQTKSPRPIIVAKEAFDRQVFDLSWSRDGKTLYACSSDGTIGVFDFDAKELEGAVSEDDSEEYLTRYGFKPNDRPVSAQPQHPPQPPVQPQHPVSTPPTATVPQSIFAPPEDNRPTFDSKGRRRIKPVFVSHLSTTGLSGPVPFAQSAVPAPFANGALPAGPSTSNGAGPSAFASVPQHQQFASAPGSAPFQPPTAGASTSSFPTSPPQHHHFPHRERETSATYVNGFAADDEGDGGEESASNPWDAIGSTARKASGKRKASDMEMEMDDAGVNVAGSSSANGAAKPLKARTLGGDRPREPVMPVRELRTWTDGAVGSSAGVPASAVLPTPSLKTHLSVRLDDNGDTFEGQNWDNGRPSEVLYMSGKQIQFLDYPSSAVLKLALTGTFCAAGLEDGSLNVYSLTGRRLLPTLSLASPCSFLEGAKHHLLAITSLGQMHVWNIKTLTAAFPPTSVASILPAGVQLTSAQIRPNGAPLLILSNGVAYSYDFSLASLVKISELRWSTGSDLWEGKQRANRASISKGVVATLETQLNELQVASDEPPVQERPAWWNISYTLGHLETRMHAAKLLESPTEYKSALAHYSRRIAEEGYRAKAEELIKELCGPIYWKPGREESWCPSVAGLQKRDLLRDVLNTFAKSRTLAKLGQDWQDTLKKITAES